MKESNEILSSVYRATPNLFQRFMPQVQAHMQSAPNSLPIHFPMKHETNEDEDDDEDEQMSHHHHHLSHQHFNLNQQHQGTVTPPSLSPHTNELSIDQNCTPPSSTSSSTNSTITSVSPLDFNSFVAAAASSTPVMSPLMMPTPKVIYFIF